MRVKDARDLVTVRADPTIYLTALGQAHRAGIGLDAGVQSDPDRLEDLPQHIPGQTAAVRIGVVVPSLTGEHDLAWYNRFILRQAPRRNDTQQCQQPVAHIHGYDLLQCLACVMT